MSRSSKRIFAVSIIIIISILLGFAVDLIWSSVEKFAHPKNYSDYVRKYAYEYNVPESVVYSVIKVESNFDTNAASHKGAYGLMQITSDTLVELCSERHLNTKLSPQDLFDPETNIRLGTYYLSYLYERFDRNWDTALAAYNAGPGRVNGWLNDTEYSDGDGNLTKIPFEETREYVKRVNKQIDTYKKLYYENQIEVLE